jgi:outer membrane receptor protein involved in Fe transport
MSRRLLFLLPFLLLPFLAEAQTTLKGKVTDAENGEAIFFGNVVIFKDGVLVTGTSTDEAGNYSFPDIDPGTYDVEASYTGYQSKRIAGVQVLAGRVTTVDIGITTEGGLLIEGLEIVEYKVPLIEQDNTTSGSVITGETIRNLPTRNINALASISAGIASSDEGGAITVRGSRSNATNYFVDGIRVTGSLVPETEIDQLQVITGGIEAQYGDVTGGIISITTKGPSNTFSGGIDLETSQLTDAFNWNLLGFNASGPILKNRQGRSILGFRLAGRYQYREEDDPPAVSIFRINDEKLAELESNPVFRDGTSFLPAADFLQADDVNEIAARPFEGSQLIDLTAKLDARLSNAIDISLTGAFRDTENQFAPGRSWTVLNSHNNPTAYNDNYRVNFRFRHRLGRTDAAQGSSSRTSKGILQNASYTLQFGYEKGTNETYDARHGFNYFNYGHVGNFDIDWVPTFAVAFDPDEQQFFLEHTDYRQVLRDYQPGDLNPVLANYNKAMNLPEGEGLNSSIGNYIISGSGDAQSLLARQAFVAPNGGLISSNVTSAWGFHTNVGTVFNTARFGESEVYTFNGRANFDLVPGKNANARHNIQLGFMYEQRIQRSYGVAPRGLWDIARQQVNNHIQGIEEGAATVGSIEIDGFGEVDLKEVSIVEGEDSRFYRAIRDELGVPLNEYVNVDGLSPDQLRMDMFSAKELNDQGIIAYAGYDYLGTAFDGTFNDFFTATDADGVRTFPVAPNRPIYSAAYIQDKFTFDDIIFRLGLRVDRYDANTQVLKDPYSLYEIMGANEYHANFGGEQPGSIGDDYKVYLNDSGTNVLAYRDGDQWYRENGTPVNNPIEIFSSGLVFPKYADQRVEDNPNFIKSPDFDPSVSFEDYEPQINIMPRLAFSFPISDEANFFAHYDILVQRPASNTLATAVDYFYFTDNPSIIKNNPDLRPTRTIDYEVGFQQKLSNSSKLKVSAYYKELRDMIQIRTFFPVPIITQYTTYDNQDFGTVKGFTFEYELRRTKNVSLITNYTLQFADGTGSDANSQRGLTARGNLRTLFPLSYDERHRVNVNLDFRYGAGRFYNGPRIGDVDILSNFGFNLQAVAVSGRPYTATLTPEELGGTQFAGAINGARKPWNFTLNARIDKSFRLSEKLNLNVYARASNLLDRRNVTNVYSATGSATDDGFLASANGLDKLRNIENSNRLVSSYLAAYQWAIVNPGFFTLPRRVFLGAILDF